MASNTTAIGRQAETVACAYLTQHGFVVIEQNWRTRWCEIDIIARNKGGITFFEVKYRRTRLAGSGLEYITARKLRQMQFAAQLWVTQYEWQGEYCVGAISVSGNPPEVESYLECVYE